jgi:hypothetical protein
MATIPQNLGMGWHIKNEQKTKLRKRQTRHDVTILASLPPIYLHSNSTF